MGAQLRMDLRIPEVAHIHSNRSKVDNSKAYNSKIYNNGVRNRKNHSNYYDSNDLSLQDL